MLILRPLQVESHIKKRFAVGSRLSETRLVAELLDKHFSEATIRRVVAIMLRRGELEHQMQRHVLYRIR